jgi:hypothetical protein
MSHDQRETPFRHEPASASIPPGADPVEPRDPSDRPVPRQNLKALLYAIPAVLLVVIGLGWMLSSEMNRGDRVRSDSVLGTSGERSNDPEGRGRDEALNPQPGPAVISDLSLLTGETDYAGRAARFSAVPVAALNGDRTFWVGRLGNRKLVLLDRQVSGGVQKGQVISLAGRVERGPSSEELDRLGLEEQDRDAFDGEKIYIRATEIAPAGQDVGATTSEVPKPQRDGN